MPGRPFDLDTLPRSAFGRAVARAARPLLSRALGLDDIARRYEAQAAMPGDRFESRALAALDIDVQCDDRDLLHVPLTGPLVMVANHPLGVADGLALLELVRRVRPDVRLLANHLLARIPELRGTCFFVDPFEGAGAASRSRAGLRAAHLWLRQGGAVIVFPSGEVAPTHDRTLGRPRDAAWRTTAARLALAARATVVPMHIGGANSPLFYALGHVHARLRTVLLGRELLRLRGACLEVRVGAPLPIGPERDAPGQAVRLTARAKAAVDALATRNVTIDQAIAAEVGRLPSSSRLVTAGAFDVYCAPAALIPATLEEIGRLREITYRAVGEGTSRALDLDAFDDDYEHLFVWDREARLVVGAYRLGRTDVIAAARGVGGLYTRTLFRYEQGFLDRLGPAIELGRSFVRAEYQRHHSPLMLLWKGIGAFVARHPQYRVLFGPVSISRRYSELSRSLLQTYLEAQHLDDSLAGLVEACHPLAPAAEPVSFVMPEQFEDVQRLVAATEPDGKGVPVLLRQYLKLNARVLGFNLDPAFSDVVDALMVVDLRDVRPALLRKYLGERAAATIADRARRIAAA